MKLFDVTLARQDSLAKGHKVKKTYSDISNGGGGEGSRCKRGVKPEASRSSAVPV